LRYPYEVRDAKDYFDDIPDVTLASDMVKLAEHILQSKAASFDPSKFVDRYEQALVEMLKHKQAGIPAPREQKITGSPNVINLMDALRRSISGDRVTAQPQPAKKGRKRVEGQREMLLPIGGKREKDKQAAAKPAARRKKAG
jgi:DNA end-binding protein Ku